MAVLLITIIKLITLNKKLIVCLVTVWITIVFRPLVQLLHEMKSKVTTIDMNKYEEELEKVQRVYVCFHSSLLDRKLNFLIEISDYILTRIIQKINCRFCFYCTFTLLTHSKAESSDRGGLFFLFAYCWSSEICLHGWLSHLRVAWFKLSTPPHTDDHSSNP